MKNLFYTSAIAVTMLTISGTSFANSNVELAAKQDTTVGFMNDQEMSTITAGNMEAPDHSAFNKAPRTNPNDNANDNIGKALHRHSSSKVHQVIRNLGRFGLQISRTRLH